jgi:hypothetical protein
MLHCVPGSLPKSTQRDIEISHVEPQADTKVSKGREMDCPGEKE